jgi:hypothetical protein
MATTTPNYGWDVPTSTDYVKDGAVAIETLGDDIDASLFSITGGKTVGMQLISATTFTSQSAVTLDNVFTSAYRNYKIMFAMTNQSAANVVSFRYRNSTPATVSTSNYNINTFGPTNWTNAAIVTAAPAVGTQGEFGYSAGGGITYNADIFNPQIASQTFMSGISNSVDEARVKNNLFNTTTQFAGITIYPGSGTFTGTVAIYAYKDV